MGRIKPAALLRQSKRQKGPSRPSVTTIAACNFLLVMILLSIVFISKQRGKQAKVHHDVSRKFTGDAELSYQYAVLNTSEGLVTLQLHGQQAPKAVENFVNRSQNGYYNGEKFYRVIDGFMIQGRDEGSNGTDESSLTDVNFNDEFDADRKYDPFTVTLENLEPRRLFIATVGTPHLKKHTAIGSVVQGQKVLQDMANHPADLSDPPLNQVVMDMIHRLHPEEKWWRVSCTYNIGVQLFNVKQYSLACWSLDLAYKAAWAKVKTSSPDSKSFESLNEVVSEPFAKCLALVDAQNCNGGQARVMLIDGIVQWTN